MAENSNNHLLSFTVSEGWEFRQGIEGPASLYSWFLGSQELVSIV